MLPENMQPFTQNYEIVDYLVHLSRDVRYNKVGSTFTVSGNFSFILERVGKKITYAQDCDILTFLKSTEFNIQLLGDGNVPVDYSVRGSQSLVRKIWFGNAFGNCTITLEKPL